MVILINNNSVISIMNSLLLGLSLDEGKLKSGVIPMEHAGMIGRD